MEKEIKQEDVEQKEQQKEQQDGGTPPAPETPKPLWEQKGYASADDALIEAIMSKAEANALVDAKEKEKAAAPKPPRPPKWDKKAYDEDGDAYAAAFQQEVADYSAKVQEFATTKPTSQAEIAAAAQGVLAVAEFMGFNRQAVEYVMLDMAKDPQYASLASTPQGVRDLGKLAMENIKTGFKGAKPATPPKEIPPEKQYSGSDNASHTGKDVKSEDPEEKRRKEVEKAVKEGRSIDVVKLALQKGLPRKK